MSVAVSREHIIAEIKRTAELNGGEPLGLQRFSKETGISRSDWYGKFWANWGNALTDAGYQPNEFREAYSERYLIEQLIGLVRELKNFPVAAEYRMKSRRDSSFPADSTFYTLGNKNERVRKVLEYCQNHSGYDDVIAICEPLIVEADLATEAVSSDYVEFGFVYLMKSGKYYKIGHTNAVGRREYELAIQLPDKLTTIHVIKTDDPSGIEAYWHKRFQDKHKNGEWFDLPTEDIKAFKRRTFM